MDPVSRWWERDTGYCDCIYLDRCMALVRSDTSFFVSGSYQMHACDVASEHYIRDDDERFFGWHEILTLRSLDRHCLARRWRLICLKKSFLPVRDWVRLKMCYQSTGSNPNLLDMLLVLAQTKAWKRVSVLYTIQQQFAYQPEFADTIVFLPLGASILPAMECRPRDTEAAGWLWAKYKYPDQSRDQPHEGSGWVHPAIIG